MRRCWSIRSLVALAVFLAAPPVLAGGPPATRGESSAKTDAGIDPDAQMGDGLRAYTNQRDVTLPSPRAVTCPDGTTLFGIDVSKWQGDINWTAVANDGVVYSFVRVSDGLNFPDEYFAANLAASRAAGIHTGVYQFFRPNQDVIAQADFLVDSIGTLEPGDLPPVIDVEATGGLSPSQVAAAVQTWIDRVESRLGVTPIIYTGKYFWQDNVQSTAFASYPLWAAHYTTGCPNIADQWSEWAFWQYTDAGSVAGVAGGVDSNEFNGTLTDLTELTVGGAGTCGDGTCNAGETTQSCAQDCPPCAVIPPAGMDIDELDACFFAGGDPQYWRDESTGFEGHHWWTYATDSATPANYGVWDLHFEQAGSYELQVYVEAGAGSSTQSTYNVTTASGTSGVVVDQSSVSGWFSLGEFDFDAGGGQQVRIDDNSGEDWDLQLKIVVDGLRVLPAGGTATTDTGDTSDTSNTGTSDTTGETTGSETTSAEDTGDAGTSTSSDDSGGVSTGTEDTGDPGAGDTGEDKGCGCATQDAPAGAGLLLLGLLGVRRRRD